MPFFQTAIIAPLLGEVAGMVVEYKGGSKTTKRIVAASTTALSAAAIGASTVDPGGAAIAGVAAIAQAISEDGSIMNSRGEWNEMGKAFGNLLMG